MQYCSKCNEGVLVLDKEEAAMTQFVCTECKELEDANFLYLKIPKRIPFAKALYNFSLWLKEEKGYDKFDITMADWDSIDMTNKEWEKMWKEYFFRNSREKSIEFHSMLGAQVAKMDKRIEQLEFQVRALTPEDDDTCPYCLA